MYVIIHVLYTVGKIHLYILVMYTYMEHYKAVYIITSYIYTRIDTIKDEVSFLVCILIV